MSDRKHIEWSEIELAAAKMFAGGSGGSEIEWAKECWGHFAAAGLTGNANLLEETASSLRLVALARIYEEFCGHAWDENPATPVVILNENLKIDLVALGILAGGIFEVDFDDARNNHQLREAALVVVTDSMRGLIFTSLARGYGDEVKLYSRMSRTNHSSEVADDDDEFEVTGQNLNAYEYVINGFRKS